MTPSLFIRADASPAIGLGHVMRCLALAQAWREAGGRVCLVGSVPAPALRERLVREGVRLVDVTPGEEANAQVDTQAGARAGAGADARADTRTDAQAGARADARADAQAESQADARTGAGADTRTDAQAGARTDAWVNTRADARTGADPTHSPEDLAEVLSEAGLAPGDWAAFDGYGFHAGHHLAARGLGARVLVVDDENRLPCYEADVLLDQNFYADARGYRTPPGCARLFGPKYALLRREFLAARPARLEPAPVRNVLVSMGGADPDNVTLVAARGLGLADLGGAHTSLLVGPVNPHRTALEAAVAELGPGFSLVQPTQDMPGLLAETDLTVTAAGSTCWEMALMGLAMLTVELAPNQASIGQGLADAGCAIFLGRSGSLSPRNLGLAATDLTRDHAARLAMRQNAARLVDGQGAARVAHTLLTFPGGR